MTPRVSRFALCLLLCATSSLPRAGEAAERPQINSVGMEFLQIAAGTFMMGSDESDREASASEKPRHRVTTGRPFLIGKFEVTQAARAGTTTAYSFGDDTRDLGRYAWFGEDFASGSTHSVGQKEPNPWDLHDVHGNVWEWVQNWYGANSYASSPSVDPQGPSSGSGRVVRGGSWHQTAASWRSAFRRQYEPDYRGTSIGFRVVMSDER